MSCGVEARLGPCVWCEPELKCGPWNGTDTVGWDCGHIGKVPLIDHIDQCGSNGGGQNGPVLIDYTIPSPVPVSGDYKMDLVMQNIGQYADPHPRKQNITVGPFQCQVYSPFDDNCPGCGTGTFYVGYGCTSLPGIGAPSLIRPAA